MGPPAFLMPSLPRGIDQPDLPHAPARSDLHVRMSIPQEQERDHHHGTPSDAATIPAALLVEHVSKRFSPGRKKKTVTAVDDVSLRIERGEVYGILGANGGGKSTLIRLVSTLLTLDTGRIEVFGHDVDP